MTTWVETDNKVVDKYNRRIGTVFRDKYRTGVYTLVLDFPADLSHAEIEVVVDNLQESTDTK